MSDTVTRIPTACHWGAYTALVRDGHAVGAEPFARDPDPSPLIGALPAMVEDRTRIRQPMVRKGWLENGAGSGGGRGAEPFVAVSWDRALDLVAAELNRVRESYGNEAIFGGSYGWASAGKFHRANDQLRRFLGQFGGYTGSLTNYSFGAAMVLMPRILGTSIMAIAAENPWPVVAANTQLMVSFGGVPLKNVQVESGGTGEHVTAGWLKKARENGAQFVTVGPIRNDAADFLDAEWLAIVPNTDTALMMGLAHTLVAEGRHNEEFLARCSTGFERFRAYLTGETDGVTKDADWAASITGINAETIRALARRMAAERTLITVSWSVQRGDHGEQPYWMAVTLAAMLGQIGLPGGGIGFGYGSVHGLGNPSPRVTMPGVPQGENPTGKAIPVARIADMLLQPGAEIDYDGRRITYPDIRLVYWAGGNPFHHHQDLNRLRAAWRRPDTVIVHEPWWTPVARQADIVLPATTALERNDLAGGSLDRFIVAIKKAVEPVGEARNDHDIFAALADRLGFRDAFTEGRDEMGWLRHLYDIGRQGAAKRRIEMPDFDVFWRDDFVEFPAVEQGEGQFDSFRGDPDGHPLGTPSGKIEIFSETIAGFGYDDCPGHATWFEPAEWLGSAKASRYPLHMISNQPRHRLHSQLDAGPVSRAGKVAGREPVLIHPDDAAARGIADGDVVRLLNDRGACLAGAVVTDAIRPGVVQLATGAWYDPADPGSDSSLERNGNPNVLTIDKGTSRLAQAPIAQTALIEIERWQSEAPQVGVFEPPEILSADAAE